jgi:hypothetical protein
VDENSKKVATAAVARLLAAKLIRPERAKKMQETMAAGRLRAEDWKLELDVAASKEAAK